MFNIYNMGSLKREDRMKVNLNREIYMEIARYPNQVFFSDNGARYIIEIQFKNNIGIILYTLRFNEIDAIRILDSMDQFQFEFECQTNSSQYIGINPMNTLLNAPYFYFEWGCVDELEYDSILSDNYEDVPCITFKVREYSSQYQQMRDIISVSISENTFEEISFGIFFTGVIDIVMDLPMSIQNDAENVVNNMFCRGKM